MQAQIDGKVVRAKFTLPERKKASSPPKAIASTSRRDASKTDNVGPDVDKDGPKRQREGIPVLCMITGVLFISHADDSLVPSCY